jgi:hypothetical protein
MKDTSAKTNVGQAWSANEVIGSGKDWMELLFGWWYRFTTPPRVAATASFAKREADRRARLLSTLTLFLLGVAALFLPLEILGQRPSEAMNTIVAVSLLIGALLANRTGKTVLAALIIVAIAQLGMFSLILLTPFSPGVLQLYDTLVLTELVAVSLLPPRSIFVAATINSIFIALHLLYAPRTPIIEQILKADLSQALARPIALQFFVAVVVALWVYSASKSNERANRAEMVASLEHTIAEQNQTAQQEKQELEASIEQIVQVHTDAINRQVIARIPYPPAKVLWPLVGVVNSLWVRLQRAQQTEKALLQMRQRAQRAESELLQMRQYAQRIERGL